MKVGSVTRLGSAPGRSCDMMCESTSVQDYVSQHVFQAQLSVKAASAQRTAALLCIDDRLVLLGDFIAAGFVYG